MHWWAGGHLPIQACATCRVLCGGGGVMDHHPSRRPGRMSGWRSGRQYVCGGTQASSAAAYCSLSHRASRQQSDAGASTASLVHAWLLCLYLLLLMQMWDV
jgi:hypothetical protein